MLPSPSSSAGTAAEAAGAVGRSAWSRKQCFKLLHCQVEGDGQHLQVDVLGAQKIQQGSRKGLDDDATLAVAKIDDLKRLGDLEAMGAFQHQAGGCFQRVGIDDRGKGMIYNRPVVIEDGTSDNTVDTVYVAQDVLHQSILLFSGHQGGLDLAFHIVKIELGFDGDTQVMLL